MKEYMTPFEKSEARYLRGVKNLSYKRIGQMLGLQPSTISDYLNSADSKSREIIEVCPHCGLESNHIMNSEEVIQRHGKVKCSHCEERILLCGECTANHCELQPNCFEFKRISDET